MGMCLGLTLPLVSASVSVAQQAPYQIADQAFHILRKHCCECHGAINNPRSGLHVFDHAALVKPPRDLVVPRQPALSELLLRIECGSMPPGSRPKLSNAEQQTLRTWIDAGAPLYVWPLILDDLTRLKEDQKFYRHVRLDHLVKSGDDPLGEVDRSRRLLKATLEHFAGERTDVMTPVGDAKLLYRIDLRQFKWHEQPFTFEETKEKAPFNVYDLILLEYPFQDFPSDSAGVGDPIEVLRQGGASKLARPIPLVRGDWLVVQTTTTPLDRELRRKPTGVLLPAEVDDLREEVTRVVRKLRPAILPFHTVALAVDERTPDFDFAFKTNKEGNVFKPNDALSLEIQNKSDEDFYVEVVHTNSIGEKTIFTGPKQVRSGGKLTLPSEKETYTIEPMLGVDFVTIYAARERWPAGRIIKAEGFKDRLIHPERNDVQVRSFALKVVE
jgi:hypothetical protein